MSREAAAIAAPVAVVVVLAVVLVAGRGAAWMTVVDDILFVGLATYAGWCSVVAARAARAADGRIRRAWATLAVAMFAWAIGDAIWLIYDLRMTSPPSPSPADVFYLTFTAAAIAAMAQFVTAPSRAARVKLVLDALSVAFCLLLLGWILVLHRVFDTYRDGRVEMSVALISPVGDLVILTLAVVAMVRAQGRQLFALIVLTVAAALTTIGDSAYVYLVVEGSYDTGNLLDIVWAAGLAAFAAAAVLGRRPSALRNTGPSVPSGSSLWLPYVPLLLAGTIGPAFVMSGFEQFLVPIIVTVVCARQVMAAVENRQFLAEAANEALRDPLTGLANRTLFRDRLEHAMMVRSRDGRPVSVLSIDLDDFKLVNDSLGHPVADRLLVDTGKRLVECLRAGDTVARVGGDEFAVLLEGGTDDHHQVAQRIIDAFARPFLVGGQEIILRPSIGLAEAPDDEEGLSALTLAERADIAMYAAKRSRSAEVRTFNAELALASPHVADLVAGSRRSAEDGAAQVRLLGELRHAVDAGRLDVVYQPEVDLVTGKVIGVEALLRWPHPRLGTLHPETFLALVRQHGLMLPVTDLVLSKVLDDALRWSAQGLDMPVAINLFAPLLRDTDLPDRLCRGMDARGLSHGLLTVEITEDVVLTEFDTVTTVLRELRSRGIRVAIDDFGSGYSALSYLRDLAVDEVKLDRHFIASVTSDRRAAAVVDAVISLTHKLGVLVVAEGVEDVETARWLVDHRCDRGQGYYFGRPVESARMRALVSQIDAQSVPG
ncbi:bifunctional diguanylate cyclase/phosphodiesterase [Mycobacterium sp. CVI_P3]|uniref:Bifunctional diguanylate cyclase/phosphodiesterase n=1 Tax=Mycobacterium pinniadriaticum TaxID=2994102 RepID=A0ABT3SQ27_9MYCO|nr:bifunctional diguanylate cyclase/phosphodiesterase [Mycobacterium pinniadriaticum]MCX2934487.1 bifunctional diguanylate cyclase/phosphodiesterase [Mycobacterium pinniadriaticum]MCX2940927.1 bifunctional diguanylate cyclase/phosphodiesterase [Mycobacterium pinniadriaticum]